MRTHDIILIDDTHDQGPEADYLVGLVTHVPVRGQGCNYRACAVVTEGGETVYVTRDGRFRIVTATSHRMRAQAQFVAPAVVGAITPLAAARAA